MAFWKKVKQTAIAGRLVEEQLYEQVFHEVESGVRRDGLWAKAFQKSNGDEQKAKALYFEYRVQSLKDEMEISTAIAEQIEKERTKEDIEDNLPKIENEKQVTVQSEKRQSDGFCNNDCFGGYKKNGRCSVCGKPISPTTLSIDQKYKTPTSPPKDNIGCFKFFFWGCVLIIAVLILPIVGILILFK